MTTRIAMTVALVMLVGACAVEGNDVPPELVCPMTEDVYIGEEPLCGDETQDCNGTLLVAWEPTCVGEDPSVVFPVCIPNGVPRTECVTRGMATQATPVTCVPVVCPVR